MKLSYAITACSEKYELSKLIPFILKYKEPEDEIVVLFDTKNGDETLLEYLLPFNLLPNFQVWRGFGFDNDFAKWKNKLNDYCNGDYIFQLDADEMISELLIKNIKRIILANPKVDLFAISRVNIVNGITEDDIAQWRWVQNEKGWINWPDKQGRIYKKGMMWCGKVHEQICNASVFTGLPEEYDFSLIHVKDIIRQRQQNNVYKNIITENTDLSKK